jgi:DNA-directed RNA polymerase subunit RPC12/RpoP
MTLLRESIRSAAFWHQGICLSCGEAFDLDEEARGEPAACDECGSDSVVRAETALAVLEAVEREESI